MEIRIDIDAEKQKAATQQERDDFLAALFCAASTATADYGARVDFSDAHHWVISFPDEYEPLVSALLAGRTPDEKLEKQLRFRRHLSEASAEVATWPAWERGLLGSNGS